MRQVKIFYGWIIVFAGMTIMAVSSGMSMSFGVFIKPLLEEFGWSRAVTSMAYSINMIALGTFAIILGAAADRYGSRKVIFLGGIVFGLSLILSGSTKTVWELYVYYGIFAAYGMGSNQVPLIKSIALWFDKRLGLATGILMTGYGIGPLVFAPVITYIMSLYNWQTAFVINGLIGLLTILPLSLLIRNRPSDMGLHPYGHIQPERKETRESKLKPVSPLDSLKGGHTGIFPGVSLAGMLKSRTLFILVMVHFLGCVSHSIPLLHIVAMATDAGVDKMVAATILGTSALWSLTSRLGIPMLADKIGGRWGLTVAMLIQTVTLTWLFFAQETWAFRFFGIIFGIGFGGEMALFPILSREYFGSASLGVIYGIQMFGATLGMAVGGYLAGLIFDLSGTYNLAVWVSVLTGLVGTVFAVFLPNASREEKTRVAIITSKQQMTSLSE